MFEIDQELMRIGVSLPENLLKRFDNIIKKRGYSSRSEGIRDAIRNYIVDYEWMGEEEGERVGVITIIYNHHQRGLNDTLLEIQHNSLGLLGTSFHVHLDHDNCLEVLLARGDIREIKRITEEIMALKGVKHVKLTTTSKTLD
ncbi:MAG: NAD+ synthetase [Candidatus Syntrophoarchaeum butanivorans]|uniref:Putative nickel-responsive regulator n=1 Tax=Candidatus Syntropharchaeum butanivorans TaxID=1839936 RepID=A0A1F2P3J8_9EURY|nr:MAG: NAD+ synthetase [Candidatus Syntrophoarchaeum butanivorans]